MKDRKKGQETLFLFIVVLFWFAQYVYIPYQTVFLTGIGVSVHFVGLVTGAYGITQVLCRLPVGVLADTIGEHKPIIMLGVLFSGGASLIRLFFPGGAGYFAANLCSGLASSMWISFMVMYTSWFPEERQQEGTSRIILFNNVGMLMGFVVATLTYRSLGMSFLCLMSALSGAAAFGCAVFLKKPEKVKNYCSVAELLSVCGNKRLILFSAFALIQQGVQLSTSMSFTSQVLRDLGAGATMVGMSSITYMVAAVLFAKLAGSRVCEKSGPRLWIPLVFGCVVLYCLAVPRVGSVPAIFVLQLLAGMSTGILYSYATSEAMKEVPAAKKSTAMGFFQTTYAVGMVCFPMIVGNISGRTNMTDAFSFLAVVALAGCLGSIYFYMRSKK